MILSVYIDDRTEAILREHVRRYTDGRSIEQLAEAAVAEAALNAIPPNVRVADFLARRKR